jgi:hypothetical protein
LRRNIGTVAVYLVLTGGVSAIGRLATRVAASDLFAAPPAQTLAAFRFTSDLFLAAGFGFVQALLFSRLGEEMDRPLWKVPGDREAVRRFFPLWFAINLLTVTTLSLMERAAKAGAPEDVSNSLLLALFLLFLFATPAGAVIMFLGKFRWQDVPAAFVPLSTQFREFVIVLILNFFVFTWYLDLAPSLLERPELRDNQVFLTAIEAPFNLIDCLVFAAVWHICRMHRQYMNEQGGNDDFDF